MPEDMHKLIQTIRKGSSVERELAIELLTQSPGTLEWLVAAFIESDEPERRSLVMPLVDSLSSETTQQRELSTNGILQVGNLAISYLDEGLIANPSNKLLEKIKEEIQHLDEALAKIPINKELDSAVKFMPSSVVDSMIQGTKLAATIDDSWKHVDQLADEKIMSLIEINIDAWLNARSEILHQGQKATTFLIESLTQTEAHVRRIAAQLLSRLGDKRAVTALVSALGDSDVFVRDYVASALKQFDDARVTDQVARAYASK